MRIIKVFDNYLLSGDSVSDNSSDVESIDLVPFDKAYDEVGRNNYDFIDMVSELVDNSIAAKLDDETVTIQVIIKLENGKLSNLTVKDDASGIESNMLSEVLSLGYMNPKKGLNEHGMGLKQVIPALGSLDYLSTKTVSMEKTANIHLDKIRWKNIPITYDNSIEGHGTIISINVTKYSSNAKLRYYRNSFKALLGARYRRYLKGDPPRVKLFLQVFESNEKKIDEWVAPVEPLYFNTDTRDNKPEFLRFPLSGNGWKALLTFGNAPTDEECNERGWEVPTEESPYYVSQSKQGFDVIIHDRVLLFHQLSEMGIVGQRHPGYNHIRGEIDLVEGFTTNVTKNSLRKDACYQELANKIAAILKGEAEGPNGKKTRYISSSPLSSIIKEYVYRDRLKKCIEEDDLFDTKRVTTEFTLENNLGRIDILADMNDGTREIWEVKTHDANGEDVYQTYMYMDALDVKKGYLVAPKFSEGAIAAKKMLKEKHGVDVYLRRLDQHPIIYELTAEEKEKYRKK